MALRIETFIVFPELKKDIHYENSILVFPITILVKSDKALLDMKKKL